MVAAMSSSRAQARARGHTPAHATNQSFLMQIEVLHRREGQEAAPAGEEASPAGEGAWLSYGCPWKRRRRGAAAGQRKDSREAVDAGAYVG